MSIVLCVVVVGSCIAVIGRWVSRGMEPATPRPRHERAPVEAAPEPAREPVGVGAVSSTTATPPAPPAPASAPTTGPPRIAPPVDDIRPAAAPEPESAPIPARRNIPAEGYEPPRRRPTPAEAARRHRRAGAGIPREPWWVRARAGAGLLAISVALGLGAAASIGLVLFAGFSLLRSL